MNGAEPGTKSPGTSPGSMSLGTMGLDSMSLSGLVELQQDIETALKAKREAETSRVLDEIRKMAAGIGLSTDELVQHLRGQHRKPSTGKVPPKYRDPANPANLWSGRGKRPRWLQDYLDGGGTLDDCLIESQKGRPGGALTKDGGEA